MTTLGADGATEVALLQSDCCIPPLCSVDLCCTLIPAFVNLLPSGPLWDEDKTRAIEKYRYDCNQPYCEVTGSCTSMVAHSVYTAKKFYDVIQDMLWPMFREINPATAFDTMDDWLERLGWQDCFDTGCRSRLLGELTPYEVPGECGPIFCAPTTPKELEDTIKHNIILSLIRLQMSSIKNLDGINFVIEPLGAKLIPVVNACNFDPVCGIVTGLLEFTLEPYQAQVHPYSRVSCPITEEQTIHANSFINYFYDLPQCSSPAGLPSRVYPGLLSAECLVRSLLPQNTDIKITRTC